MTAFGCHGQKIAAFSLRFPVCQYRLRDRSGGATVDTWFWAMSTDGLLLPRLD